LKGVDADIYEWWETLDVAVFIHRIIGHFHITLTDCLTFDTIKVNGLFLGIFA
jgi:hypothetical protein